MGNKLSRREHRRRSAVQRGIFRGDVEKVRQLLESGDYAVDESKTLELAFFMEHYEMIELLLGYGVFPKHRLENRVLDLSVWKTKNDIAELLIQNGVDFKGRNQFGETLLYVAACANNAAITNTLIRLGLNVNETTRTWTPLHVAAQRNHGDIIRVLLWFGCDTEIKNSDSNTAIMLTMSQYKQCCPQIVSYFLQVGAEISLDDLENRQMVLRSPEIVELVHNNLFCIKPLTDLCRLAIRRCIARQIPERVLVLPLPKFLQYFVRMDDVFVSDLGKT